MSIEGRVAANINWHLERELLLQPDWRPMRNARDLTGEDISHAPRFPTGIHEFDRDYGGGYGTTVLASGGGVGKSLQAIQCGVCTGAAADEWLVYHAMLEMDRHEAALRVARAMRTKVEQVGQVLPNYRPRICADSFTLDDLIDEFRRLQDPAIPNALCIVDSVNVLAENGEAKSRRTSYFDELARIVRWAVSMRRHSDGRLAFLLVSETNQDGVSKGRNIEFKGDVVIRIKPAKRKQNYVEINVVKARDGASPPKNLGEFYRDWARCRFIKEEQYKEDLEAGRTGAELPW